MSTTSIDRPLSQVQEHLARSVGAHDETTWRGKPDVWLRLDLDGSGAWVATVFGAAFDRPAADALTVPLSQSAQLLAVAAAKARRPLVVHTTDEQGVRYVDVLDPPASDFHQVSSSVVDAAANADTIRSGLRPAVWSPDRVTWSPVPSGRRTRRQTAWVFGRLRRHRTSPASTPQSRAEGDQWV